MKVIARLGLVAAASAALCVSAVPSPPAPDTAVEDPRIGRCTADELQSVTLHFNEHPEKCTAYECLEKETQRFGTLLQEEYPDLHTAPEIRQLANMFAACYCRCELMKCEIDFFAENGTENCRAATRDYCEASDAKFIDRCSAAAEARPLVYYLEADPAGFKKPCTVCRVDEITDLFPDAPDDGTEEIAVAAPPHSVIPDENPKHKTNIDDTTADTFEERLAAVVDGPKPAHAVSGETAALPSEDLWGASEFTEDGNAASSENDTTSSASADISETQELSDVVFLQSGPVPAPPAIENEPERIVSEKDETLAVSAQVESAPDEVTSDGEAVAQVSPAVIGEPLVVEQAPSLDSRQSEETTDVKPEESPSDGGDSLRSVGSGTMDLRPGLGGAVFLLCAISTVVVLP